MAAAVTGFSTPSASSVNQDKSNYDFDNGGTQHDIAIGCYYTDSTWEARDEVKGDVARMLFYMATRYEGEDGDFIDLELTNNLYLYESFCTIFIYCFNSSFLFCFSILRRGK